jgi:hypothetical protein
MGRHPATGKKKAARCVVQNQNYSVAVDSGVTKA